MAQKVFSKALMASENVQSYVGSCKFYNGADEEAIYDGALVNIGELCDEEVYGGVDYNMHKATAPTKLTREDVCIVDLAEINEATVQGNVMKLGNKLVGLELAAGGNARFRRLMKGDKFWVGEGCFDAMPTVGQYATAEAGVTTFKAAAAETAGQINFAIRAAKALTVGQSVYAKGTNPETWEQLYLVEVL